MIFLLTTVVAYGRTSRWLGDAVRRFSGGIACEVDHRHSSFEEVVRDAVARIAAFAVRKYWQSFITFDKTF